MKMGRQEVRYVVAQYPGLPWHVYNTMDHWVDRRKVAVAWEGDSSDEAYAEAERLDAAGAELAQTEGE